MSKRLRNFFTVLSGLVLVTVMCSYYSNQPDGIPADIPEVQEQPTAEHRGGADIEDILSKENHEQYCVYLNQKFAALMQQLSADTTPEQARAAHTGLAKEYAATRAIDFERAKSELARCRIYVTE